MKRREALRYLALGIPAGILFPSLLTSCKDEDLLPVTTFKGKVIIIGSGVSGLYAAYLLKKQGVDVSILEAAAFCGGRIRTNNGFADFPIELGAEEIHGSRSVWYDMVRASGASFISYGQDFIQIDNAMKNVDDLAESDADIKKIFDLLDKLEDYSGGDITAEQYGQQQGFPQRVQHLYEALFGTENGTTNDRLGLQGVADADRNWASGSENFMVKDKGFYSIITERMAEVLPLIQYNKQIQGVLYSNSSTIALVDQNGSTYLCDKLIITVPLTVLRDGDITFTPALSSERVAAFNRIGMGAGMKIILRFSSAFWDPNTTTIYSSGFVAEYWVTSSGGRSSSSFVLTAFVMGARAEALQMLGAPSMINALLADLDAMYGVGVATGAYLGNIIQDWTAEPYIRGAYSFSKPGDSGARATIAAPVENRIFFAGEHTHTEGHFGTVHGAMETGFRAVKELLNSVKS